MRHAAVDWHLDLGSQAVANLAIVMVVKFAFLPASLLELSPFCSLPVVSF